MTTAPGAMRVLLEGVLGAGLVLPVYLVAARPRPTTLSAVLVLVVFFGPPLWVAARLRVGRGTVLRRALAYLGWGLVLGLAVGAVGGVEKWLVLAMLGEALPVAPGLWSAIALLFALATGLAYGIMLGLLRGLAGLLGGWSDQALASLFGGSREASRGLGLVYSVLPGLGHVAMGCPERGRPWLVAALATGLAGLVIVVVALILLVEAGIASLAAVVAGAVLLLVPVGLAIASAIDLLLLRLPVSRA